MRGCWGLWGLALGWAWPGQALAGDPEEPQPLRLCAERVWFDPEGAGAEGDVELIWGELELRASAAGVGPGVLTLRDARLDPCGCGDASPWSLGVRELRLDLEAGRVEALGPRLYVGTVPVLGLPRLRAPLERLGAPPRVWPGLPAVGRGPDGWQASVPVELRLEPGREAGRQLTVAPEWRQERGLRGLVQLDTPRTATPLRVWGGWDTQDQAWRGAAAGTWGVDLGGVSAAVGGQRVSDSAWIADFGGDLPGRALPWTSARALVGVGPLGLELRAWQQGLGAGGPLEPGAVPSVTLRPGRLERGALGLEVAGRADLLEGQPRVEGAGQVGWAARAGPVELGASLSGRAWAWDGPTPAQAAALRIEPSVALPVHRVGARGALELRPSLSAGLGLGDGGQPPLTLADPAGVRWGGLGLAQTAALGAGPGQPWLAPGLSLRAMSPRTLGPRTLGPGLARLDVHAPLTPGGLALAVGWQGGRGPLSTELRWASRPWAGPGRGWPEHVGSAGLRWEGERVEWGAQLWRAGGDPAVNQGLVRAAVPLTTARATWRPALVVLASPEGWQSAALGLDWSARCACASWGVMASVAQDQPGLRLGASASLTPSSWGSSSRGASSPGSAPPGSLPLEQLDPRSPLQP